MFFLTITLHAQTENSLFTPIKLPKKLTDEQAVMVTKIEKYPNVKNVQYVTVNDYTKFVEGAYLIFAIPNEVTPVKAKIKRSEIQKNGDYVLYAIFENSFDDILLIKEKEKVFGTMSFGANSYRIYGIGKGFSALMTLDETTSNGQCGNDGKEEPHIIPSVLQANSPEVINPCIPSPLTSVLCLFTDAANATDPAISQTATIGMYNFNNALSNSAVSSTNARIIINGVVPLSGFMETSNGSQADLDRFAINPDVQNLRNQFSADVVVLFTNGDYGNVGGRTRQISAEEPNAYCLVEVEFAVRESYEVFIHELGHIFGGRHENDVPSTPTYSHGMDFDVRYGLFNWGRKEYRTIMRNRTSDRKLISHFSNPDITYQGVSTGNSSCCNVASVISENAPRISSFRTTPSSLSASILGMGYIYESGSYYWEPSITCGVGPYTTQWDVIFPNGQTFYSETVDNDGQLRLDIYPYSTIAQYGFITIRMTVRSSDNQETVSFMNVYIDSYMPFGANPVDKLNKQSDYINLKGTDIESIGSIFPNPATSKANFDFVLNRETEVTVSLFDSQGKEVRMFPLGKKTKGYNQQEIDISNLKAGIYLCRITAKGSFSTQKFSIVH